MAESARAIVTVTLEIQVGGGAWGANCTVAQVHKQALDSVRNRVSDIIRANAGVSRVGEMTVKMITHDLGVSQQ